MPDNNSTKMTYASAIWSAFDYLLENHSEVLVMGQGLWSPWYVGSTMLDLDKKYGADRVIDSPVSESAVTGAAVGASMIGSRPIVVHPRMDFMLYAIDAIVNQAAKWRYMTDGGVGSNLTIRAIINRGGEQGAQHSQSLHAWFCNVPGLRVVMPYSVQDARDLFVSAVLSDDPVLFIDDRWLYDCEENVKPLRLLDLKECKPEVLVSGEDITIVSSSYSTRIALEAQRLLAKQNISAEVVDLRVVSPIDYTKIVESCSKTGRLLVVDGGWSPCGLAAEVIASVSERLPVNCFISPPQRISLPFAPAPTATALEHAYYPDASSILSAVESLFDLEGGSKIC